MKNGAIWMAGMLAGLVLVAAPQWAFSKVLASAGTEKVTEAEFNDKVAQAEKSQGKALTREEKVNLLRQLLNQRLLVAEANARGLGKDPAVKAQIEDGTRQVLANTLFDREIAAQSEPTRAEVEAFYRANPGAMELARASHILIKAASADKDAEAREKADKIYRRLKDKPEKFAETARQESADAVNRDNGGDLGFFARGRMVPEFDQAVFNAKAGEVVGPVKTQFGYHVILVKERRTQTLQEAGDAISQELRKQNAAKRQQEYLEKLAKKYKASLKEKEIK